MLAQSEDLGIIEAYLETIDPALLAVYDSILSSSKRMQSNGKSGCYACNLIKIVDPNSPAIPFLKKSKYSNTTWAELMKLRDAVVENRYPELSEISNEIGSDYEPPKIETPSTL